MEVTHTVVWVYCYSKSLYFKDVLVKFKEYLLAIGFQFNDAETPMSKKLGEPPK